MTTQIRQSELTRLLSADFQKRTEPQFSHGNIVSTMLSMAGLVAYWPMSGLDSAGTGEVFDISGNNLNLDNINTATNNFDMLVPYMQIESSATRQIRRNDEASIDIIGNEPYIGASFRGFTIMGWVWFDVEPAAAFETVVSKYDTTGNQRAWNFRRRNNGTIQFSVSTDGINDVSVVMSSANAINTAEWVFIAARFDPSTELKIWQKRNNEGNITATNTTSIPATIFNSSAELRFGGINRGVSNKFTGRVSHWSMYAMALSDVIIENFRDQSKVAYGVF